MPYDRFRHHRRSIRLKGYDYAGIGAYYVTICVWDRECLLGEIIDDKMVLNEFGRIVSDEWAITPEKRTNIILDVFVVMPNHLHGVFIITENRSGIALDGKAEKSYGDVPGNHAENPGCMGKCMGGIHDVGAYCNTPLHIHHTSHTSHTFHAPAPPHTPHVSDGLRSPSQTVGAVVRGFKGAVTKRVNQLWGAPGSPVWQRNYYERIIRNQNEFDRIRRYIINNPANWNKDIEHPSNTGATIQVPDDICKEV